MVVLYQGQVQTNYVFDIAMLYSLAFCIGIGHIVHEGKTILFLWCSLFEKDRTTWSENFLSQNKSYL